MKSYVCLRLKNRAANAKFPDWVWTAGYQAAPQGYAFKPLIGSFDMSVLGLRAATDGLECHVCDRAHAKSIHGLPV